MQSIWGRIPALAGLILAVAIGAGCGSSDDTTLSSGPPDVALNQTSTAAVDSADSSATKDPAAVGVPVLNELEPLRRAQDEPTVPAIRGSEGLTIPQWLSTVDADVANYWQKQFNDAGYRYKPAEGGDLRHASSPPAAGPPKPRSGRLLRQRRGDLPPGQILRHDVEPLRRRRGRGRRRARERPPRPGPARAVPGPAALGADRAPGRLPRRRLGEHRLPTAACSSRATSTRSSASSTSAATPRTCRSTPRARTATRPLRQNFFAQGYDGGEPGLLPAAEEEPAQALARRRPTLMRAQGARAPRGRARAGARSPARTSGGPRSRSLVNASSASSRHSALVRARSRRGRRPAAGATRSGCGG